MPLPVIPDVFRCAFTWTASSVPTVGVNVLHVSAPSLAPADIAGLLDSDMPDNMFLTIASSAHALTVDITALDGTTPGAQFPLANWDGSSDTSSPLVAVAQIISFRTAVRGPMGRGRIFVPFVSEGEYDSGMLNALHTSQMKTAWDTYFENLVLDGVTIGVASYQHAEFNPLDHLIVERAAGTIKARQDRLR